MVGLREIAQRIRPTQIQIDQIQRYRNSLERVIKGELSKYNIRFYYAGSYAKNTGISKRIDLDIVIRFPTNPIYSTRQCYEWVYDVLRRNNWNPRRKNAAIRISNLSLPGETKLDHADLVPEQQIANSDFCYLWLNKEQQVLQTSVHRHIQEIQNLRMNDLVRLMKFWKYQYNLTFPSFILEQSMIRWSNDENIRASTDIISRLQAFVDYLSRRIENLRLVDPANSRNIITSESNFTTSEKRSVASTAANCLSYARNQDWNNFFLSRF